MTMNILIVLFSFFSTIYCLSNNAASSYCANKIQGYPAVSDTSARWKAMSEFMDRHLGGGVERSTAKALTTSVPCNNPRRDCRPVPSHNIPYHYYKSPVINGFWGKRQLVVSGNKFFIKQITKAFNEMAFYYPGDVAHIYYNGGFGCRYVKPSSGCKFRGSLSLHSWGFAMDLNPYWDPFVLKTGVFDSAGVGCSLEFWYTKMWPFMVRNYVYWGGGFGDRDSHHWELSRNAANGFNKFGTTAPPLPMSMVPGHPGARGFSLPGAPPAPGGSAPRPTPRRPVNVGIAFPRPTPAPVPPTPPAVDRCKLRFGTFAACGNPDTCIRNGGQWTANLCPGGKNNRCCHPKAPAPSPPVGAPVPTVTRSKCEIEHPGSSCKWTSQCTTQTVRHKCPGPVNFRCCLKAVAPVPPPPPVPTRPPPGATPPPVVVVPPPPTPAPIKPTCTKHFGIGAACVREGSCRAVIKPGAYCPIGQECCTPDLCTKAFGGTSKCLETGIDHCPGSVYPGAYCTGGQHCCGPLNDEMPFGALQTTAHGVLEGWACDPDAEGKPIDVHIYEGGPAGKQRAAVTSIKQICPKCLGKPMPPGLDFKKCNCKAGGDACRVGFAIKYNAIFGLADYGPGESVKLYAYAPNIGKVNRVIALAGNGIVMVMPPKPPLAECDDFTIVGCGACTAANEGKTCKWCSQADGIDQCVDRTTKCPHDMEPSLNEEECDARAVREEEALKKKAEEEAQKYADSLIGGLEIPPGQEPPAACLLPDACDSRDPCCDLCSLMPAGAPCEDPSPDGCKEESVCDGVNAWCPSRPRKLVGTACNDFNECTQVDKCAPDGRCYGELKGFEAGEECGCKSDEDCRDGNECSKDICDVETGKCNHVVSSETAGRLCRRVLDRASCDLEEFCDGTSLKCPEDKHECPPVGPDRDESLDVTHIEQSSSTRLCHAPLLALLVVVVVSLLF